MTEPTLYSMPKCGWIEVVAGCMFSGKTEELIRRLTRAKIARQKVVIFKPAIDVRYADDAVVTHTKESLPCIPVESAGQILNLVGDAVVVGIDEAQFFDQELVEVVNRLADDGHRVVVAGLDQDFMGRPFEPMPQLLCVAEYITKTLAVCMQCGAPADRSQRMVNRDAQVLLGSEHIYEARCRSCWNPHHLDATQERLPL
jgi:thymidine kinase